MKQVTLPSTISFGATASAVSVNRVNVAQDDSGDWQIGVRLQVEAPERAEVDGIRLQEKHNAGAQISVTRVEIAGLAIQQGLVTTEKATATPEEIATAVRALPLETVETIVTTIAMGKLLAVFGISA